MTTAIIFSRNRAAQLDLLLRSLQANAPALTDDVHVVWQINRNAYGQGYTVCEREHPAVAFQRQFALDTDTLTLIENGDETVMFLTDDSVFYQPLPDFDPADALASDDRLLCFSLRLGLNTTDCYPLRRPQASPRFERREGDWLSWRWRNADADFGYPGSLDGHVFRREDALWLIDRKPFGWMNPNELEERLVAMCPLSPREWMGCYEQSVLVGVPVNKTGVTHLANRTGETYSRTLPDLNAHYLSGQRLRLDTIPDRVTASHAEFPLEFAQDSDRPTERRTA